MELSDLTGRVIETATAEVHIDPNGAEIALLFVRLDLAGGGGVRMGCASDGQSLRVDDEPLNRIDMAEYGATATRAVAEVPTHERIEESVPLVDGNDRTFGVMLATSTARVFVFNWADELHAQRGLPDVVRAEAGRPLPL